MDLATLRDALVLQAGYNAALVMIGASLLGLAGGAVGTFVFLRKRALVSDAVAHATLPGIGLAFMAMVALGGDGRNLAGLMLGSALSAGLGLVAVDWLTRKTRLTQDAAIGAVLSVFFGFGVVLMTVIQTMSGGRQAGLQGFLVGSTAGMLRAEAIGIAVMAALAALAVFVLRRPFGILAFDADYAVATGLRQRVLDLALMGLALLVTIVGLKVVGLVLVVALLIIPAVTARFWTQRADRMVLIAAALGAVAGYVGAALSVTAPRLPTGALIVLVAFGFFALSLVVSPVRGVAAALWRRWLYRRAVHRRQGLLALARGETIFEPLTLRILQRSGFIRPDGVATPQGLSEARRVERDEARWRLTRETHPDHAVAGRYDGLTPIETVLTRDEIADLDRRLATGAAS
jgi:manganese/zinc/iron transport system permease protein